MRAPLSWLNDFAPFGTDAVELASVLSNLGLVVEGIERIGEGLTDVIVGRVLGTRPHPSADRVQLVDVDDGSGNGLQVVCGAFNFAAGDLIPLATIGARLPGGMEIARRKVRGQWSEGMLCSSVELALPGDSSGILVLGSGDAFAPGTPLVDALGIVADSVFEVDVTPNRPDALSIAGLARDLAASLGLPFSYPKVDSPVEVSSSGVDGTRRSATITDEPSTTLVVEAVDLCSQFAMTVLTGATVMPSPSWLARRLVLAGMRPVNSLVDISNYVMLELGQPNHPYDLNSVPGPGLMVREAGHGENLVTLDGTVRLLGPGDCVIADRNGDALGIAGIMGGASSEISPSTTRVLLEMAWFSPVAVASTAKRLGLRTEASVRFERGVDPGGIDRARARYLQLARDLAGATEVESAGRRWGEHPPTRTVTVRVDRVNAILGTDLCVGDVTALLDPIGFTSSAPDSDHGSPDTGSGTRVEVLIPSWRPDCEREIDVIEEVARHHGYRSIPRTLPVIRQVGSLTPYQRDRRRARQVLVGRGLLEAWATSFSSVGDLMRCGLNEPAVELENPMVAEESVLRPSLLPGLLRALVTNASHRNGQVGLFEIGHVFLPPVPGQSLPQEPERLAVLLGGAEAPDAVSLWRCLVDGLKVDGDSIEAMPGPGLHPGRSAKCRAASQSVGWVGELDPGVVAAHGLAMRVAWLEVDLGVLLSAPRRPATYRPVSRFPSSDLDLAFQVDDKAAAALVETELVRAGGELLESVVLFDVFRGAQLGIGTRSLAWRLRFSALDRTLTEEELTGLRQTCIEAVESALPAKLRA